MVIVQLKFATCVAWGSCFVCFFFPCIHLSTMSAALVALMPTANALVVNTKALQFKRQTRLRQLRKLSVTIASNGTSGTMTQKQMLYDSEMPFRGPYLGPMTQLVQEIYDENVETFFQDTGIWDLQLEQKRLDANFENAAQRCAFTYALYGWMENALNDTHLQVQRFAQIPNELPTDFHGVLGIMMYGQQELVKEQFSFLWSEQTLADIDCIGLRLWRGLMLTLLFLTYSN